MFEPWLDPDNTFGPILLSHKNSLTTGRPMGFFRKLLPESRSSQGELSNDTKITKIDQEEPFQITLTSA